MSVLCVNKRHGSSDPKIYNAHLPCGLPHLMRQCLHRKGASTSLYLAPNVWQLSLLRCRICGYMFVIIMMHDAA